MRGPRSLQEDSRRATESRLSFLPLGWLSVTACYLRPRLGEAVRSYQIARQTAPHPSVVLSRRTTARAAGREPLCHGPAPLSAYRAETGHWGRVLLIGLTAGTMR